MSNGSSSWLAPTILVAVLAILVTVGFGWSDLNRDIGRIEGRFEGFQGNVERHEGLLDRFQTQLGALDNVPQQVEDLGLEVDRLEVSVATFQTGVDSLTGIDTSLRQLETDHNDILAQLQNEHSSIQGAVTTLAILTQQNTMAGDLGRLRQYLTPEGMEEPLSPDFYQELLNRLFDIEERLGAIEGKLGDDAEPEGS